MANKNHTNIGYFFFWLSFCFSNMLEWSDLFVDQWIDVEGTVCPWKILKKRRKLRSSQQRMLYVRSLINNQYIWICPSKARHEKTLSGVQFDYTDRQRQQLSTAPEITSGKFHLGWNLESTLVSRYRFCLPSWVFDQYLILLGKDLYFVILEYLDLDVREGERYSINSESGELLQIVSVFKRDLSVLCQRRWFNLKFIRFFSDLF